MLYRNKDVIRCLRPKDLVSSLVISILGNQAVLQEACKFFRFLNTKRNRLLQLSRFLGRRITYGRLIIGLSILKETSPPDKLTSAGPPLKMGSVSFSRRLFPSSLIRV